MRDRRTVLLARGVFALLVASCTTKTQPQPDWMPQKGASVKTKDEFSTPARHQRVVLYVEGMTKIQGIT